MTTDTYRIWNTIQKHMVREKWVNIEDIYTLVESHMKLDQGDYLPLEIDSSEPRWKTKLREYLLEKASLDLKQKEGHQYQYLLPVPNLIIYHDYTRRQIHDIFEPETIFFPQAGVWGLHGFAPIVSHPGDYAFMVTFGKQQGDFVFDEGVTKDGVLTWQSQPNQKLDNDHVQAWINHDELVNTIYLFLRANENKHYTYLGRLKYLSHDNIREQPVHFKWQILDWHPDLIADRIGLELEPPLIFEENIPSALTEPLTLTKPTKSSSRLGSTTENFRRNKLVNYAAVESTSNELNHAGQLLVLCYEQDQLISYGRSDLSEKVRHTSVIVGENAGYDIASFTPEGRAKFIKVKTTTATEKTPFYMTANEVAFARQHPKEYYIYRVYEYKSISNTAKFYQIHGDIDSVCDLIPSKYRVTILRS